MATYTLAAGRVARDTDEVYASWMVEADTEEQAIERSKEILKPLCDEGEIEAKVDGLDGLIFRINPDALGAASIIDVEG